MSDNVKNTIVVVAAVAVIVVAVLYVSQRFHYGCFLGNCAAIITK